MAFTFVEIEEHKSRKLAFLFTCLVALYAGSILVLVWGLRVFVGTSGSFTAWHALLTLGVALTLAALHWAASTLRLVDRALLAVRATPLDAADTYHGRFRNIVEEVSVATGGRYQIQPAVIMTSAMNACSVADSRGRAAIAVTEGLLARLTRAQVESVVGHEAAHIANGDSLFKSACAALFGLHEEALKRLTGLFSGRDASSVLRGRASALLLFAILVLWVTQRMKRLFELMASRTLEYRADATAVRLTRNPLALAEALHLMSKYWRGMGTHGESLASLFIVHPGVDAWAAREGRLAEWLSTHPPTGRRIDALLGMVSVPPEEFDRAMAEATQRPRPRALVTPHQPVGGPSPRWYVQSDGTWQGPFLLPELAKVAALRPDAWIRREGEDRVQPAYGDPDVLRILRKRFGTTDDGPTGTRECPNCFLGLARVLYEGVPLDRCPVCQGCYVTQDHVTRVFVRREYDFSDPVKRLAASMASVRRAVRIGTRTEPPTFREPIRDRRCPACQAVVVRQFYTLAYPVTVERCILCGLTWLDRGELEVLQCLYERRDEEGREG